MERESAVLKHTTVVQPFLKDAFKEGAHRKKPKRIPRDQWFRQIMIGVVYNDNGSTATLEELADKHGMFRQSVSKANKTFLRNLWNSSSPELQERYPLSEIRTARKSLSQRSRERISASGGGRSLRIKAQIESGVTDRNSISENTGIPKRYIVEAASTTLKDWGINVPRKLLSYKETLKQLEEGNDDSKLQQLLDELPFDVIKYDKTMKRQGSCFSSLSPLIREAGFRSNKYNHLFATSLETAGIPISRKYRVVKGVSPKTVTYYFLLSRHKDRVIQALKDDQSLQRFQRKSS